MKTWKVPAQDPKNKIWISWDEDFGGYYWATRTPEGDYFPYPERLKIRGQWIEAEDAVDPLISLPALVKASRGAIDWGEVSPEAMAQLRDAPNLVYLDDVPPGEELVANVLRLALAS